MSLRYPLPSLQIGDQLMSAFQLEKQQLQKIQQQNRILTNFGDRVLRKQQEIEELQKLIKKYKKYYDQYQQLMSNFNQKTKENQRLVQENKVLFSQMNKVMADNKTLQDSLLISEKAKLDFVKERNSSDVRFRQIQATFREYQQEWKKKEKDLLRDLEKAYEQIKESNTKIQDLQSIKFENQQLKLKINNLMSLIDKAEDQQNINQNRTYNLSAFINNSRTFHSQASHNVSKSRRRSPNKSNTRICDLEINGSEIESLKRQLMTKQMQLQRSKSLNHELSIEFDKSVNKICEFEKELSLYRKQNHELKKTLSLFVEKEQYEKMHHKKASQASEVTESEQQEQSEGVGYSQISYMRR